MTKTNAINKKGFTLLEILVAMAILAVVLSVIYASFTKTLSEINETESEADIYQMARITLERMHEDLECALLLDMGKTAEKEQDTFGTIEFQGKNEELDDRDADSLIFLSAKHLSLNEENKYSGLTRIAFYVKKNDQEDGLILYRSDTPEIKDSPEEKTGGVILCDSLFSVNFTYFDTEGNDYDEWDSADGESKGKLPEMVSIELNFINKSHPEAPLKFETGVALPMAGKNDDSEP